MTYYDPHASYNNPPEPEEQPACPECGSTLYDYVLISSITHQVCGCTDCLERWEGWEYREDLNAEG